jgi:hypothetical protein
MRLLQTYNPDHNLDILIKITNINQVYYILIFFFKIDNDVP